MTIYVESNFALELALEQEQYASALEILFLGENGSVELCFPAFSIGEPLYKLAGDSQRRRLLVQALGSEAKHFTRSSTLHTGLPNSLDIASGALTQVGQTEERQIRAILGRILSCAQLLPISAATFSAADSLTGTLNLGFPDAIVMASILNHLKKLKSGLECVFVTRDGDFDNGPVRTVLKASNCRLITSFDAALKLLKANSKKP